MFLIRHFYSSKPGDRAPAEDTRPHSPARATTIDKLKFLKSLSDTTSRTERVNLWLEVLDDTKNPDAQQLEDAESDSVSESKDVELYSKAPLYSELHSVVVQEPEEEDWTSGNSKSWLLDHLRPLDGNTSDGVHISDVSDEASADNSEGSAESRLIDSRSGRTVSTTGPEDAHRHAGQEQGAQRKNAGNLWSSFRETYGDRGIAAGWGNCDLQAPPKLESITGYTTEGLWEAGVNSELGSDSSSNLDLEEELEANSDSDTSLDSVSFDSDSDKELGSIASSDEEDLEQGASEGSGTDSDDEFEIDSEYDPEDALLNRPCKILNSQPCDEDNSFDSWDPSSERTRSAGEFQSSSSKAEDDEDCIFVASYPCVRRSKQSSDSAEKGSIDGAVDSEGDEPEEEDARPDCRHGFAKSNCEDSSSTRAEPLRAKHLKYHESGDLLLELVEQGRRHKRFRWADECEYTDRRPSFKKQRTSFDNKYLFD